MSSEKSFPRLGEKIVTDFPGRAAPTYLESETYAADTPTTPSELRERSIWRITKNVI